MTATPDERNASGEARVDELLCGCLEEGEAHLDEAVEKLCQVYPDHAAAVRAGIETARTAGLTREPNAEAEMPPPSGAGAFQPIGPYQPLSELGRGGQGLVYLAEDTRLHRVVALKILKGFGPLSEKMMQRFKREAEVASKLDHPGICGVYDAGVKDGIPYIAMRFVEGKTLADLIRTTKASLTPEPSIASFIDLEDEEAAGEPVDDAAHEAAHEAEQRSESTASATATKADVLKVVEVVENAARALHVAHEAGVIHRDIKPGNIMVTPTGEPVLLDFGLASEEANELSLTQTGDMFGTPAYMSPEQLMAQHVRLDRRTDVYSLAVTLYECVTLQRPFDAPTREGMYQAIQYKHATDVRKLNREIPVDLKTVLEKGLEKDRDQRYETALDFAEDLRRVRELKPVTAKRVSAAGRLVRWAKRRPARAALAATLIIGVPAVTGLASYAVAKAPEIRKGEEAALNAEVERHLEEGYAELAHGDPKVALASFDAALALKPDSGEAIGGKALAFHCAYDYEACLAFVEQHGDVEGVGGALRQIRIDVLRKLGRTGEADDLARSTTTEPRAALGFFLAGLALMQGCEKQGDKRVFRTAFDYFTRAALTATHARQLYHLELGHAAQHLGEEAPARQAAGALLTLWPESDLANNRAGTVLGVVDSTEALAAFRNAIELKPGFAEYYVNLGLALADRGKAGKGQLDEAIAAFEKAIELKPDSAGAHSSLGTALAGKGRFDDAIAAYRKAIELNPYDAKAYLNLGSALVSKGQIDDAIAAVEKVIELNPDSVEGHYALGITLMRQGRLDEAIAAYEKAIELKPDHALAYCNLGTTFVMKGQTDEAIAAYEKAIEVQPDFQEAHYSLGAALQKKGQLDEAIAAYEKAIELKPDYAEAHCNLGTALRQQGHPLAALVALRKGHLLGTARANWRYPSGQWLRDCEGAVFREAQRLVGKGGDEEDADAWLDAAEALEALLEGWRADLDREDRKSLLARWLERLGEEPWTTLRDPAACKGLPADESERWRKIWTDVDQLAQRLKAKK